MCTVWALHVVVINCGRYPVLQINWALHVFYNVHARTIIILEFRSSAADPGFRGPKRRAWPDTNSWGGGGGGGGGGV